jgi:hypothetical protein
VLTRFVTHQASLDEESPLALAETQSPGADREEFDGAPLSSVVEIGGPPSGLGDELHSSPLQTESSLSSSPQPTIPPQVEHVDEVAGNSSVVNREEPPSPTPSEHGSDGNRLQLLASEVTDTATDNGTRPPSPVTSVPAGSFSNPRYHLLSPWYTSSAD